MAYHEFIHSGRGELLRRFVLEEGMVPLWCQLLELTTVGGAWGFYRVILQDKISPRNFSAVGTRVPSCTKAHSSGGLISSLG